MNEKRGSGRREYWQKRIEEHAQSGKSVSAFCRERDLREPSFYEWRRRLRAGAPVKFALVETRPQPVAPAELELHFGGGERLRIPAGADPAMLRAVLAILRERP